MKKILFFAAAAVAMLTGCSQNDDLTAPTVAQNAQQQEAIQFGMYMGRQAQTRAGATGTITTENLKTTAGAIRTAGFGVYALYTGDTDFDAVVDRTPNFMWNQQVSSDGTKWSYSPVKYWPNGNATADNTANGATGEGGGKVSFFAYAPWVSAGANEPGITAVSNNTDKKNPSVSYRLSQGENFVDLLWGSTNGNGETTYDAAQNGGTVVSTTDGTSITTSIDPVAAGPTNINLTKQKIKDGTVNFLFKHALTKIGGGSARGVGTPAGIQIMLDVDDLNGGTNPVDTKVTVKEIKITTDANGDGSVDADEKIVTDATLDLATGLWKKEAASESVISMTTSRTANDYYELNNTIMEPTSALAKTTEAWDGLVEGVKVSPKSIYKKDDVEGFVFFPGEEPKFRITVDYIVRTKDANLANKYTEVEQVVTKVLQMPSLEMNKIYNILIHLGLTSVKFTASVSEWGDANADGTVDPATEIELKEVWVPTNVLAVAAGSTSSVNISKTTDSTFTFEVTGLGASQAWTAASSNTDVATVTASGTSDANGKATIVVTTKKNTGAARSTTITVTKTSDASTTTLTINQAAGN